MSKGSNRRPEDKAEFDDGYDKIFSGKVQRGKFIWDKEKGDFVPADEYVRPESAAPFVMGDIQPYQSMQTGEMIASRSHHREHLKRRGLIEIGNEVKAAMTKREPKRDREKLRRQIAEVLTSKGY